MINYRILFISLVLALSNVLAIPVPRAANATSASASADPNILVLQFANVLEQLETSFYSQALSKFQNSDFIAAGFSSGVVAVEQIQSIGSDESIHNSVLTQAILDQGSTPLNCTFDFSKVLADVNTMITTARLVEMVGVGAYLGAASLVTDPVLLTSAASIMTTESRHQTMLNIINGGGAAVPQAFDIPLTPPQVLAIAGPFIQGCDLGISANRPLAITNTGTITEGTQLSFDMSDLDGVDATNLTCQMIVGGASFALAQPLNSCVVPNITGPMAVYITNSTQPLLDNPIDQFAGEIVLGPTIVFIDQAAETLMALVRTTNTTADSSSIISPQAAGSIIASASATVSVTTSEPVPSSVGDNPTTGSSNHTSSSGPSGPGQPNLATGASDDGHTVVLGWQNLPAGSGA